MSVRSICEAKKALDIVIKKSRVHMYKPIQIAEILHRHRTVQDVDLDNSETYRNPSKLWRDNISQRLVGRISTSSQKYQDNIFDSNAMPHNLLKQLCVVNKKGGGIVEAYIYKVFRKRLSSIATIDKYINSSTPDTFKLEELFAYFESLTGLSRSTDKLYEILVYAIFATIVAALNARVTIEIGNENTEIQKDFELFIKTVLGMEPRQTKLNLPATLYRIGVTNAADAGLDIVANFGLAIQVKHSKATDQLVAQITDNITAEKIVLVCTDNKTNEIKSLLKHKDLSNRIQGISTIEDITNWCALCFSAKYRDHLGKNLLEKLNVALAAEFPSLNELEPFERERGYDKVILPPNWQA